jgi:thiol-disulfide isomerase/thioredoxin
VKEFPSLKNLVQKMNGKVKVIAVSNDNDRIDLESFLKAFGELPAGFTVVWDKSKRVSEIYGTQVLPESFIIGPNRKLIRKVAGIDQWDSPMALRFFSELTGQ